MAKDPVVADPEGFDFLAGPDTEEPVQSRPVITDPELDPASPKWNPRKYFGMQEKVVVVVKRTDSDILSDPTGVVTQSVPVMINGYTLTLVKGKPTKVPKDFADYLVEIGAAYRYADIPDPLDS